MSSIRNPRAKKDASLKKDHRVYAWEGDKTFRGQWKKKKRLIAKQDRISGKEGIRKASEEKDEKISPKTRQPKRLRKTGVVTLKRDLEINRKEPAKRFSTFGYSCSEFTR